MNLNLYPPHQLDEPFYFGDYKLLSYLGTGGSSNVFAAVRLQRVGHDVLTLPDYAVKLPLPQFLRTGADAAIERCFAEARQMAAISHPNVATVRDVGIVGQIPYLATDRLVGRTLFDQIQRRPETPPIAALEVGIALCRALTAIHQAGLAHLDINPGNIFLTHHGMVKVLDLGIAEVLGSRKTRITGFVRGTIAYMASERLLTDSLPTTSDDVFSMGLVLAEMALDEVVFDGETPNDVFRQHLNVEAHMQSREVVSRVDDYCPGLGQVVEQCLRRSPEERPSAKEVEGALLVLLPGGARGLHEWYANDPTVLPDSGPTGDPPRTGKVPRTTQPVPRQPFPNTKDDIPISPEFRQVVVTLEAYRGSSLLNRAASQESITIGSGSSAMLQVAGEQVDELHAVANTEEDGSVTLLDLGSDIGISVRGERVDHATLQSGDSFEIGNLSIRCTIESANTLPEPPTTLELLRSQLADEA